MRYYRVFNVEQCDGLKALYGDDRKPVNPITECESIVAAMPNPPRIEQHSQAFYRPSADMVGMPSRNCFESPEAYYSTLFHELTHSSGHKSRLNRFEESATDHQFGSESYSKEELVAEMGAAMLAGIAGISHTTLGNSACYLQTWITRLKSDSRLIIDTAWRFHPISKANRQTITERRLPLLVGMRPRPGDRSRTGPFVWPTQVSS